MTISPGTRIKELRTISKMSQEELGRRIGVQRAAINKYEKGMVTNIPLQSLEKIASVFDVSPTYLVGWDDSNTNPLAVEVRVIQGIERFWGKDAVELLEIYSKLRPLGKTRLILYANEVERLYPNEEA